jgi:hypothetical protein
MLAITGGAVLGQTHAAQINSASISKPATSTKQAPSNGYHEKEHIRNYYKSAGL